MVAAGAQPARIARHLFGQKPLGALQLEARILSRLRLLNDGLVVHSYLSDADLSELGISSDWTENLIDLIRSAQGSDIAVLITHSAKGPRVSLRSATSFDVSQVAKRFGGGGHKAAAGISWPEKSATREQILDELLPLLPSLSSTSSSTPPTSPTLSS
jgi:phosphoesterase RecJ-like protein